jgi:hypothetical protein
MSAADKKSNPSQIAQAVLDETNQAVKVTIVSGGTGVGADVNLTDIKGVDVDVNTGNATAGTQRVVLASDQPTIPVDIQDASIAVSLLYTEDSVTIYAPNNNTTAIPVSGTVAVTSAALTSIDTKTPALDGSKQPVIPSMTSGGHLSVTTAATGTNWTAYAAQALKQLTVSNQTGVNIEFRQGGAGVGFIVPTGAFYTFFGLTNANQLEARRVDISNTQVSITARWEV